MTAVLTPAPAGGFEDEDPVVKERLEAISRKAAEAEVPCEVIAEHAETVAQGVLACAARCNAFYIVMASRGLGTFGAASGQRDAESAQPGGSSGADCPLMRIYSHR